MASSFEMDCEEIDELLDSLNTSTPNTENSDLCSSQPNYSDDNEQNTIIINGKAYVET